MKEQSLIKHIFSSFLILLVVVIIMIALGAGLGAVGIPLWPFVFFLMYYASVEGMKPEKYKTTAIGGFIGLFVGLSDGIVSQLLGNDSLGGILSLVFMLALATAFIMGDVPWANTFGMLLMTIMTSISVAPCVWAGLPERTDMGGGEAFLRITVSYALGVLLFGIVNTVIKKKTTQKQLQ